MRGRFLHRFGAITASVTTAKAVDIVGRPTHSPWHILRKADSWLRAWLRAWLRFGRNSSTLHAVQINVAVCIPTRGLAQTEYSLYLCCCSFSRIPLLILLSSFVIGIVLKIHQDASIYGSALYHSAIDPISSLPRVLHDRVFCNVQTKEEFNPFGLR